MEKLGNVDQMASVLEMSKGDVCDILSADLSQLYVALAWIHRGLYLSDHARYSDELTRLCLF